MEIPKTFVAASSIALVANCFLDLISLSITNKSSLYKPAMAAGAFGVTATCTQPIFSWVKKNERFKNSLRNAGQYQDGITTICELFITFCSAAVVTPYIAKLMGHSITYDKSLQCSIIPTGIFTIYSRANSTET